MPDKPTYLGLLNAIALVETRAHAYLSAWADVTPSPEVRSVLVTIAAREGEHGMSFAKRINELGFELREADDPNFDKQMEIARSAQGDLDKIEALGLLKYCTDGEPDVFDGFFADHSIDIRTGELLGRYIAEERDTLRILQGCQHQLQNQSTTEVSESDRLEALEDKIDAVCRGVEELRQIVCAQAMPTNRV